MKYNVHVSSSSPGGGTWGEVCHLRLHLVSFGAGIKDRIGCRLRNNVPNYNVALSFNVLFAVGKAFICYLKLAIHIPVLTDNTLGRLSTLPMNTPVNACSVYRALNENLQCSLRANVLIAGLKNKYCAHARFLYHLIQKLRRLI